MSAGSNLWLFLLPALLGRALISVLTRGARQTQRDHVAALVAALPQGEEINTRSVLRSGSTAVWSRRLGLLVGIAAAGLYTGLSHGAVIEGALLAFGCGYLLGMACGETQMARPLFATARSSTLDARVVGDYLSRRVRLAIHAVTVLAAAVLVATAATAAADGKSLTVTCSQVVNGVATTSVGTVGNWPGVRYAPLLLAMFVALSLIAESALRLIARRPRPAQHPTLVYLDDTLRRSAAQRIAGAALGTELLTLSLIFLIMGTGLSSACYHQPTVLGRVFEALATGCGVAALVALFALPSSRRQFEPVRTLPDGGDS